MASFARFAESNDCRLTLTGFPIRCTLAPCRSLSKSWLLWLPGSLLAC